MNEIAIATEKQASAWKVKKLKKTMKVEKKGGGSWDQFPLKEKRAT
jgi:hypothetical protein